MKVSRFLIWFIILIVFAVILIDWPTVPVKFQIGDYKFDRVIKGPNLESIIGGDFTKQLDVKLGLDLEGGTYVALKADMSGVDTSNRIQKLEDTRRVLENRINQFGVSETNIYTSVSGDDYKIIVELPGAGEDVDRQIDLLKATAKLEFYKERVPAPELPPDKQFTSVEEYLSTLFEKTNISGGDLVNATVSLPTGQNVQVANSNQYQVVIEFSDSGFKKFDEMAKQIKGKRVAITLDGQLIMDPPSITEDWGVGGAAQKFVNITGSFTKEQAEDLAIQLRGGALPVPIELSEQRTVEATLGKDALYKSLIAGAVGILLVMLFMIWLYKKEGLVASVALVIYTLISLALFKLIPITLTVSGIAGFILSIGIAVDANVLIFERMNEEKRKGKSKSLALRVGFERAWTSIRDSNLSTMLTCFILYYFGSTVVKGFAVTLFLGVIISLFTAVTVTRQFLALINYRKND